MYRYESMNIPLETNNSAVEELQATNMTSVIN